MVADSVSKPVNSIFASDHKRDAYGFSVRPQHVQTYREYVNIYKVEEEERSDRWNSFLEEAESRVSPANRSENNHLHPSESDKIKEEELNKGDERIYLNTDKPGSMM